MTDTKHYPAELFWSSDDNGYIATAPDLPGCSAFGRTQQEAIEDLQLAIEGWIAAAQAVGNEVPPPSQRAMEAPSGRILLRMPRELHAKLARQAELQGTSLNQWLIYLLSTRATEQDTREPAQSKVFSRANSRERSVLERFESLGSGRSDLLTKVYSGRMEEPLCSTANIVFYGSRTFRSTENPIFC